MITFIAEPYKSTRESVLCCFAGGGGEGRVGGELNRVPRPITPQHGWDEHVLVSYSASA